MGSAPIWGWGAPSRGWWGSRISGFRGLGLWGVGGAAVRIFRLVYSVALWGVELSIEERFQAFVGTLGGLGHGV